MKALAIGAHPDDVEIGCGATLARLAGAGVAVTIACATFGEQGTDDVAEQPRLAEIRRAEAVAAGKVLGAESVRFLGLRDGLTSHSIEDKIAVIRLIREIRPDMVFVHAKADVFPDHAVVHALAMASIVGAQGPWYAEAGGAAHTVRTILGYEVWHPIAAPALIVPSGDAFATKLAALGEHASQTASVDYVSAAEGLGRYRGALSGEGGRAEAFEVLRWSGGALPFF